MYQLSCMLTCSRVNVCYQCALRAHCQVPCVPLWQCVLRAPGQNVSTVIILLPSDVDPCLSGAFKHKRAAEIRNSQIHLGFLISLSIAYL